MVGGWQAILEERKGAFSIRMRGKKGGGRGRGSVTYGFCPGITKGGGKRSIFNVLRSREGEI